MADNDELMICSRDGSVMSFDAHNRIVAQRQAAKDGLMVELYVPLIHGAMNRGRNMDSSEYDELHAKLCSNLAHRVHEVFAALDAADPGRQG